MVRIKRYAMALAGVLLFMPVSLAILPAAAGSAVAVHSSVQIDRQDGYRQIHLHDAYCGTDTHSEEARRDLAAFEHARSSGMLTSLRAGKSAAPPTIGQEQSFNVSEGGWMPLDFRLMDVQEGAYYLWVEIDELDNGNVTNEEIASLRSVLLDSTPAGSIDPSGGILENNHSIFGQAPNVDGDGIVDLLMYDIGRGSGSTLGYVHTADLNPAAAEGEGNGRDVLYLDSAEGTARLDDMAAIAAHEYTHLIHANYGWDETFVTEGYAEYAMVMNGYYWRGIEYLAQRSELALQLFTWRTDPNGGPATRDYQRGGLFFTYVADRTSPQTVGRMLQARSLKGARGIDSVLVQRDQSSLGDMVLGFHTANRFNDTSIREDFGYAAEQRSSMPRAILNRDPIDGEEEYVQQEDPYVVDFNDGGAQFNIAGGAVKYYGWTDVADIRLAYDTPGYRIFPEGLRESQQRTLADRNRVRLVLEPHGGGEPIVRDVEPSTEATFIEGEFDAVTMIVAHLNPGVSGARDALEIRFAWTPLSMSVPVEDAGEVPAVVRLGQNYPNPFNPATTVPVELDESGRIRLEVFDLLGRRVALLADELLPAGEHRFIVRADSWPSGQYLVRLVAGDVIRTRQMTLLK